MSIVDRAAEFAGSAHAGQVDQQGRDYFTYHLSPIAESLRPHGVLVVAVGYLHDILEDTDVTAAELAAEFGDDVASAVVAVTRVPGEIYSTLIARAAAHPVGRLVKLADNKYNLANNDLLAETDPTGAASLRKRYEKARVVLLAG